MLHHGLTSLIAALTLTLALTTGFGAAAHGGHDDALFAPEFAEFAHAEFRMRELPDNEPTSYVVFRDGRKVYLDSQIRDAVQRAAAALVRAREPQKFHHDVEWREWSKHVARSAGDNLKHLFSRRFVLEIAGSGVEAFYRFGVLSAALIVVAEAVEHTIISPLLPGVPLCQLVYASCVYFSREAQEIMNVLNPAHLTPLTLGERISRWRTSRSKRKMIGRALKHVYRVGDDADLSRLARNRHLRDSSAGSSLIYGGWFGRGFFRATLADVVAEDHDHDHADVAEAEPIHLRTVRVPVIDDLSRYDEDVRVLRTEEFIAKIELIFDFARLAAEDLTRNKEGDQRVRLATTWEKTPGFLALRRDLARMRKSLDNYKFGLRMRTAQTKPRAVETLVMDQQFSASLGVFLKAYIERLDEIEAGVGAPVKITSTLWTVPAAALARARAWLRTANFCDRALTSGLLSGPSESFAH